MKLLAAIILPMVMFSANPLLSVAGQTNGSNQEIASLVSQLSWDSVGGECNGIWRVFPDGESAKKLVLIGKPATDELLMVLEDENRGVAAHLVLSEIWEPKRVAFGNRLEGDKFIHTYNGLEWVDILILKEKRIESTVEKGALVRNAEEWRRKLARLR